MAASGDSFHDTDEVFIEMAAIRRGCILFAIIMALLCLFMFCGAVAAPAQTAPDIEFRSLFQIRYALPDTVQLQHIGYNIRLDSHGVECVPLNPAQGTMPPIPVQSWIQGDSSEWIGVTKSGGTVTLWNCCAGEMYLEIAAGSQVVDFFNMAPAVLTWKERNKM